jgi:2-haloalkanoic acid dehalogenase type II
MSRLTDFRLLCFDVYGTLIDWEAGLIKALRPLLEANNRSDITQERLLGVYHEIESNQRRKTPGMAYSDMLSTIYPQLAEALGLEPPSDEDSRVFGQSAGTWPAFPDTVGALRRLSKHYKLVVLSNVDRQSFAASNAGPLQGFPFDLVITAQDVGSYKPDLKNFETMLDKVKAELGIEKPQILQTAQSQHHDHQPARKMGIKSVWIVRPGALMGNTDKEMFDWKFDTLGDMAEAVEKELES